MHMLPHPCKLRIETTLLWGWGFIFLSSVVQHKQTSAETFGRRGCFTTIHPQLVSRVTHTRVCVVYMHIPAGCPSCKTNCFFVFFFCIFSVHGQLEK